MSTPNFNFQNRCIVVTNEDIEDGNYPELEDTYIGQSSRQLSEYSEIFNYITIVMTYGYYSDACIDFIDRDEPSTVESYVGYYDQYESKKALFEAIHEELGVSVKKCYELCKNQSIESSYETIDEYLKDKEMSIANKLLDDIKKDYGYDELRCLGVFSNGEAIYEKM